VDFNGFKSRNLLGRVVPEGPLIVARHFNGGWAEKKMRVPSARLKRTPDVAGDGSAAPPLRDGNKIVKLTRR